MTVADFVSPEAYEAAGRAYCVAKFSYSRNVYVSEEARERHISNDARATAHEGPMRAAVDAVWSLGVAEGRKLERAELQEEVNCAERYFCPTSGEDESPCHGGFDVCCDQPDQHVPRGATRNGGSVTAFAHGVAEGRRQAAAEIRNEGEIVWPQMPHEDAFGSSVVEWAARIAEGNTDATMVTKITETQP